ncbi:MAG: hypothetical protein E7574_00785 [Ruminococcaceae bacterium]|nr:hypothetical protein [Oscillospiraceae bacterium]
MSEYANYDDFYDPDEENEFDARNNKKITIGKIIKKTITYSLRLLALFVAGLLFYRIMISKAPEQSKEFLWTETSISAYNDNPSEFKAYLYKHPDNFSQDGLFSANDVYFIPSIGQFQITVRYNNSTLKRIAKEYELKEIPDGEQFVYTITDTLGNTYTDYKIISFKKNIYNYNRIVFENIDLNATKNNSQNTPQTNEEEKEEFYLLLNVYYAKDVVLSTPLGIVPVYDNKFYHEPIDLSEKLFKNNKATSGLSTPIEYEIKEEPEDTQE